MLMLDPFKKILAAEKLVSFYKKSTSLLLSFKKYANKILSVR